jgi:hypothetical protein
MTQPFTENFRPTPKWGQALGTGGLVCGLAALASHLAPPSLASFLVALVFLGATYLLCLRRGQLERPGYFGLEFGGLLEPEPLSARKLFLAFLHSLTWALGAALLIFPAFAAAFPIYHNAHSAFSVSLALDGLHQGTSWFDVAGGQLLVVALPEEVFFRGYLQTRLRDTLPAGGTLLRPLGGLSVVVTSALFALGHFATIPFAARLAVFFPSLVFGLLRYRTGSVGASVIFHALSNLFAAALLNGYGLL